MEVSDQNETETLGKRKAPERSEDRTEKRERIPRERKPLENPTNESSSSAANLPVRRRNFPQKVKVNRENVCPTLLRVFVRQGVDHIEADFFNRDKLPKGDVCIHVWKDTTLRELTELLKEPEPSIRNWGSRMHYRLIYPDRGGRLVLRELGVVDGHRNARDDFRTLDDIRWQYGDFIAATILEPEDHQEVDENDKTDQPAQQQ